MEKDVKLVRLLTGEDVLCKVRQSDNNGMVILGKAKRIVLSQQGAALVPVCPFSEEEDVEVREEHVLYTVNVVDEIAREYQNSVGDIISVNSTLVT